MSSTGEHIDIENTTRGTNAASGRVQSASFLATNLDASVKEAGTYTLQVIHKVHFLEEEEILTSRTIIKKTDVEINATIGTSE